LREKRDSDKPHDRTKLLKRIATPEMVAETISRQTELVIDFFINDLGFKKEDIVYFSEDEVRSLVKLFD
jgi:DNA primase catalytic subunit